MDNKGFMGPRFAGMPQMMPLKADGTEMTEEENKRFMMQHAGSMQIFKSLESECSSHLTCNLDFLVSYLFAVWLC